MTYGELKLNVADLGFDNLSELMSTVEQGQSIAITSMNRAINIVHKTVTERFEKYFEEKLSVGEEEVAATSQPVTIPTHYQNEPTIVSVKLDGVSTSDYAFNGEVVTVADSFETITVTVDYKWKLPKIEELTEDTPDDFKIQVPDKLIDLVPLLSAHYAWLDDDVQKATIYWNEYDDLKNQLMEDMNRLQNVKFHDFGYGW